MLAELLGLRPKDIRRRLDVLEGREQALKEARGAERGFGRNFPEGRTGRGLRR